MMPCPLFNTLDILPLVYILETDGIPLSFYFCFTFQFLSRFYVNNFSPTTNGLQKKNIENGDKCEKPGYQTVYYIYGKMSMVY